MIQFGQKQKKRGQESWQLEKSENIAGKIVPCKILYDLSREKGQESWNLEKSENVVGRKKSRQ